MRLPTWLMITLGMFSLAIVALVVLICVNLRVEYRIERCTHHGLKRTIETGTAWLNPFYDFDAPFLTIVSVNSHKSYPTRIEQDYPNVFRVNLATDISKLETDNGSSLTTSGCGNAIIQTYEDNEVFRQAIRRAVDDGRLDPFDLLPLTNFCNGPPSDSDGMRSPPGTALVISLLHESLPRPALPVPQSTPSSPTR